MNEEKSDRYEEYFKELEKLKLKQLRLLASAYDVDTRNRQKRLYNKVDLLSLIKTRIVTELLKKEKFELISLTDYFFEEK